MRKPPGRAGYRCDWCTATLENRAELLSHLLACPVRGAVRAAESRAGRALAWKEIIAVRDQARRELKAGIL